MTIPDEVAFAFNPYLVSITGMSNSDTAYVQVHDDTGNQIEQIASIKMDAYNGKASVDISAYLRRFSDTKGTGVFSTMKYMEVYVLINGTAIVSRASMRIVYGAMFPGEVFNPSRRVKLWRSYPQIVSFYHPGNAKVYIQNDDSEPTLWKTTTSAAISNYTPPSGEFLRSGQIVVYASQSNSSTFTMQFDGTFTGDDATIINIDVDRRPQCDDHIFLRWLDKLGFWQYWLFAIGQTEISDAVVGEAVAFLTGTTYPYYASRNIGKNLVKSVTVCAANVTKEEWEMISSIKGSVNVCAYDTSSKTWLPVNVSASTNVWKRGAYLQDFLIKVIYPTMQTQRL